MPGSAEVDLTRVGICGLGAVSPAGWGVGALAQAVNSNTPVTAKLLERPCCPPVPVRPVPPATVRPAFLAHPRLRRTSPITHYTVYAALEALGSDAARVSAHELRLGIVYCVTCGCVNYSRRFYDETLKDPLTASPLVFPETVFNAPASHLAAFLDSAEINYTLAGDQGTYLQGLALGAHWLTLGQVDACLVIGAEEMDWLTATAVRLFEPQLEVSEGSGALYLKPIDGRNAVAVELESVTDAFLYTRQQTKTKAAQRCRNQLGVREHDDLLCDGLTGLARNDSEEALIWADWKEKRLSPKRILGEAFTAATAWQCVAAAEALRQSGIHSAIVSAVGNNQQALAARFLASDA